MDFRPFIAVTGGYTSGLSGVSVNPNGNTVNDHSFGLQLNGGVSGVHSWKHVKLGIDYHASLRHNPSYSYYDGTNQMLSLSVTDRVSRHATLVLRESAGLMSNNFSLPTLDSALAFDPSTAYIPSNDFYDNRTIFMSTQADLTLQRSARMSFDFGGDGFLQRRRSSALFGVTGAGARGDMQYRLTRRSTIGAGYQYAHYSYTGIFSSTDLHSLVATYALQLTHSLEFSGYAGASRLETKFVQLVPLDPAIAALLGIGSFRSVAYTRRYVPNVLGRLSYTVRHGVFSLLAGRTVMPGNGVFLTSTSTHAMVGYAYTGLKRWSVNTSLGYTRASSLANVVGRYGGYQGHASLSRQLIKNTHGTLSAFFNKYESPSFNNYNRWTYTVQLGFAFAPGDVALRLW